MKRQSGFTLVELVVVIVILGILAAIALPKYINITKEANTAAVNGAAGGLRAGVAVVQGRYFATGTNTSPVTMADGTAVAVGTAGAASGVPTVAGIQAAVPVTGMTVTAGATTVTYVPTNAAATCVATYDSATGATATNFAGC